MNLHFRVVVVRGIAIRKDTPHHFRFVMGFSLLFSLSFFLKTFSTPLLYREFWMKDIYSFVYLERKYLCGFRVLCFSSFKFWRPWDFYTIPKNLFFFSFDTQIYKKLNRNLITYIQDGRLHFYFWAIISGVIMDARGLQQTTIHKSLHHLVFIRHWQKVRIQFERKPGNLREILL